jgi:hypothetical protein
MILQPLPSEFLYTCVYEENLIFFLINVGYAKKVEEIYIE